MTLLPVIVIRPQPGLAATLEAARVAGLEAHGFPLFCVSAVDWQCPDPSRFDGLIAGSANAFRLGGAKLADLRGLPVHVVGAATARAAEAAGFQVQTVGEGGLQAVLDRLPHQRLLRLAGARFIALAPPTGTDIETRIVYAAQDLPLPPPLVDLLTHGGLVLLHSGEAARHFARCCADAGVARERVAIACLAPRIAEMAGSGWHSIGIAEERTDRALLALARQMCQNAGIGGIG